MIGFWKERKVFVTGATGFLGSWLCKALVENGADVTILIRDQVPKSNLNMSGVINSVNIVRGGLEDYRSVERSLNEYEIDTCFHLGAQAIVGTANRSPLSTFESNIKGTWNVLEACRNSKLVERVVVSTSDKAYGSHEKLPYKEDAPLQGMHPYDVSKSCADLISRAYFQTYGLPVSVIRSANFYGGGDLNFNRIVPGSIKSILFGEEPVIRSDGKFIRDYIYVLDAVDAFMALAEKQKSKSAAGQAFNLGTENPISVLDLVNKIIELSGSHLKPKILNNVSCEIREQYLDCGKIRETLDWRHKYSLEMGLKETIKWFESFFKPDL